MNQASTGASIGLARAIDKNSYGYLSEYHAFGKTDEEAGITPKI